MIEDRTIYPVPHSAFQQLCLVAATAAVGVSAAFLAYSVEKAIPPISVGVEDFWGPSGDPLWGTRVERETGEVNGVLTLKKAGSEVWVPIRILTQRGAGRIIGWAQAGSLETDRYLGPKYEIMGGEEQGLIVTGQDGTQYGVYYRGAFALFDKVGGAYVPKAGGSPVGYVKGSEVVVGSHIAGK